MLPLLLASSISAELRLEQVLQDTPPIVALSVLDGRPIVATLPGVVSELVELENGTHATVVILDLRSRVVGADGLGLWSVVADETPRGHVLYVHYAERETFDAVVSRFVPDDEGAYRLEREDVLIRIPKERRLHYGGTLAFDATGHLVVATGESTGQGSGPDPECLAQSLESLQGKLLRLDVGALPGEPPFYEIPDDNPFLTGSRGGGRPEIWALGLRNPWRFSFDRETGDLWLSDVGGDRREEIDFEQFGAPGGVNYGWKRMEGSRCGNDVSGCQADLPPCDDPSYQLPHVEYSHQGERCSIIGGYVYRGRLVPELYGRYVFGDFCSGEIWALEDGSTRMIDLGISLVGLVTFGEGPGGELYAGSLDGLYRLVDDALPPGGLVELESTALSTSEGSGSVQIGVVRVGGLAGRVSVTATALGLSAASAADFETTETTVVWEDGETGRRPLDIQLIDDELFEDTEDFEVRIELADGSARLGARARALVTIVDDDPRCLGSDQVHCLGDGRFRVEATWATAQGTSGVARARSLTDETGAFWFFDLANLELVVKVLDGCAVNNRHWVFAAGLTDVEVQLDVTDTVSGTVRRYESALGQSFDPIRDVDAFVCE